VSLGGAEDQESARLPLPKQALARKALFRVPLSKPRPSFSTPSDALICTLQGHTDWISAVAVTPDGRHAVSASNDRTLRLWDLETGQTLRILQGHTDNISAVAITPDGRRAVSASWDRTLRVWDLETGQTIRILEGHRGCVSAGPCRLPGTERYGSGI